MGWQNVQQLIDLILFASMDQVVIALLKESNELTAEFLIEISFLNELFDNFLLRFILLLALLLSKDASKLRHDV